MSKDISEIIIPGEIGKDYPINNLTVHSERVHLLLNISELDHSSVTPQDFNKLWNKTESLPICLIAHACDNPFKLFVPMHAPGTHANKYPTRNNIPDHFYQVIGNRINNARFPFHIQGQAQPDWTRLRDMAVHLNVNDVQVACATAEQVACAWTDEVLLIDARSNSGRSYPEGIPSDGSSFKPTIEYTDLIESDDYGFHGSISLQSVLHYIDRQDEYLNHELLNTFIPMDAMRLISSPITSTCTRGLGLNSCVPLGSQTAHAGLPNWFIRAKYHNRNLHKHLPRNFRHVVVVGSAKAVATGDFKPAKLFQWLSSLGRSNTTVFFLD